MGKGRGRTAYCHYGLQVVGFAGYEREEYDLEMVLGGPSYASGWREKIGSSYGAIAGPGNLKILACFDAAVVWVCELYA